MKQKKKRGNKLKYLKNKYNVTDEVVVKAGAVTSGPDQHGLK